MKTKLFLIAAIATFISPFGQGCDEQCLKEKAQIKYNKKFPSHLSWRECDTVAHAFMTSTMAGFNQFRSKNHNTKYKGPFKNIRAELNKQKIWLTECDEYFQATSKKRIFENTKETKVIFNAMDSLNSELTALINGASYSAAPGEEPNYIMNQKFDDLFDKVDKHKTRMDLKGKYAFN